MKQKSDGEPMFEDDTDEIEILEVVGLDEEFPAASAGPTPVDEHPDEVVVALDDEPEAEAAAGDDGAIDASRTLSDSERLVRIQADFDNLAKRVARERAAQSGQATADLVERLLPVLDNFERAVQLGTEGSGDTALREGIMLIFRQFLDVLRQEGLVAVDTVGEPFDPSVHEAVETDRNSSLPPGTVVEELQRGYKLRKRLIRPALVKVRVETPVEITDNAGREERGHKHG